MTLFGLSVFYTFISNFKNLYANKRNIIYPASVNVLAAVASHTASATILMN